MAYPIPPVAGMETIRKLQPRQGRNLNGKVRVLVACSATEKRQRWGQRLQEAFALFEVAERMALEQTLPHLEPDVLLLDVGLLGLGGVRRIPQLQCLSPQTKIIALAARLDDREGLAALEGGARGYDSRDVDFARLRKAIEKVTTGEIWIHRGLIPALLDVLRSAKPSLDTSAPIPAEALRALTPREYQVAELITEGARNKEIAQRLSITERTVKAHLTELYRNFNVSDRLRLAVLLNRGGLRLRTPAGNSAL